MIRRLLVEPDELLAGTIDLGGEVVHYARDVLRLRAGAEVELLDGAGRRATATIVSFDRARIRLEARQPRAEAPPRPAITLIQAIAKGEKMDQLIRQAAELGAARVRPVVTARAVAERAGRVDRWRTIAADALRVSGRAYRTAIDPVAPLEVVLSDPRATLALSLEVGAARRLRDVLSQAGDPASVEVVVGPEGGLEDGERAALEGAGFLPVGLGPYTLRTETAGPAVLAVLAYALESLG
jgi:16S rRNA (uracil1498-N3)-methyltransferase